MSKKSKIGVYGSVGPDIPMVAAGSDGLASLLGGGVEETVEASGEGRITGYTDPKTGKTTFVNPDGTEVSYDAPKSNVQQEGEKILSGAKSAKAYLALLKEKPVLKAHRVEVGGIEWFFRPISGVEAAAIGMVMSRDRDGGVDVNDTAFLTELMVHVLHKFFVADASAEEPLFESVDEVKEFIYNPAADMLPLELLNRVVELMPNFFKQLQAV